MLVWGYYPEEERPVPLRVDADGSIHVVGYVDYLNDIGDVNVPAPSDDDVLYWDTAAGEWQCKANWVAAHKATHQNGGSDEINVGGLSGLLADDQHVLDAEVLAVAAALVHASRHQNGGADEISVAGLSGELADNQPPKTHKASHENGGGDEISIDGLDGSPAQKGAASGLASLNASTKVVEQPASITDHLEGTPTEDEATKAPTSEWAYDHKADKDAHHSNVLTITFIIDGGGSAITTGQKGHLEIPFACTITQVTVLADQSGDIVVDIWKDTYANFPPTDGDSITASAPPTISSAQKSQDSTLTGWTTSIAAGDILAFNVDSCSTITRVTISLRVTKT